MLCFFFHCAASSHTWCLQQLFSRKCGSDRVVLLGFLAAMAPKKTATKAAAKPVKRLTTKGKPTADEQAKQVRCKNQANMVTQVKNAHDKLLKVQKGEIAVSDKEQEDLQVKAGFYARYITLDRFAPEKLDMLESFMNDKTCNSCCSERKAQPASPRPWEAPTKAGCPGSRLPRRRGCLRTIRS